MIGLDANILVQDDAKKIITKVKNRGVCFYMPINTGIMMGDRTTDFC
jgi:hypothetical protein